MLFDTDPSAGLSLVRDLANRQREWQAFVEATKPRRKLGMFGRALGSQAAITPLNR